MLSMHCFPRLCSDVENGDGFYCLHSGSWECTKHDTTANNSFYRRLQCLPLELKFHILYFCPFHILSNPELWFQNQYPFLLSSLLKKDSHFASREPEAAVDAFSFTMDHVRMNVVYHWDVFANASSNEYLYRSNSTGKVSQEHSDAFGTTNRYNCFYYRSCGHYDMSRPPHNNEVDGLECWRRMASVNGVVLNDVVEPFLCRVEPSSALTSNMTPFKMNFTMPQRGTHTMLSPGVYYFEFIDYAWEKMVAAVDGRPRHFLLDPAHTSDSPFRGRIPMSLIFRRVCRPADDVGDAFRLVKNFEGSTLRDSPKHIFITFLRTGKMRRSKKRRVANYEDGETEADTSPQTEPSGSQLYYKRMNNSRWFNLQTQMVYKHALSPMLGVTVRRLSHDPECDDPKSYAFCIRFEKFVRLVNLEENENGVRLNFSIEVTEMLWRDRVVYGAALANLVNLPEKRFYAFEASSWSSGFKNDPDEITCAAFKTYEDVFETLFCK